jgi:DNA processing protein
VKAAHAFPALIPDMDHHERLCYLALSTVDFLSPLEKHELLGTCGTAARLFELSLAEMARLLPLRKLKDGKLAARRFMTRLWDPGELLRAAAQIEERLTASGIDSIFYGESSYPPQLAHVDDPPLTLFLRGKLPDNGSALAGIVGTRFPTGAAREAAFRLGFECGREGIGVVSGLARGIDREAHEGCIAAAGLSVAVLGNGIDDVYPVSSRAAAAALLDRGGAIVSEYPPGTPPLQHHFPARNRIISGLCRSVVVVQAPEKSGALFTADFALQQGRDLYVHAAGLGGRTGEGTRRLHDAGAPLLSGVGDILRDWGREPRPRGPCAIAADLPEGKRVAAVLRKEIEGACVSRAGEIYWRT